MPDTDRLDSQRAALSRRSLVRAATAVGGVLAATSVAAACGADETNEESAVSPTASSTEQDPGQGSTAPSVLVAFYSRAGENYYYGGRRDLDVGNTKVLVEMLTERIDCDVFEIQPGDPYSDDYDDTVARNVREQDRDARPSIANDLPSLDDYDVVVLASGLWNVRPPMIMRTFTDALDFTGKTVHPVATYAVSGIGDAEREYAEACDGARIGESLAVRGEEVRDAGDQLDDWLARAGLRQR